MRIVSQNGLLDVPYELLAISPYSGNAATIVGTFPGNDIGKEDRVYILGEYSTKEKAKKVMEMCRENIFQEWNWMVVMTLCTVATCSLITGYYLKYSSSRKTRRSNKCDTQNIMLGKQ